MSLNFLNSHLLWLLAFATVPLLLHLFARTRPPVYEFSSVEFLRKIIRKTMRMKKPQDYLLLLLRSLAVLALIGVFLRPLLFAQEKLSGLFQKKNLVVIVDASASMAYVEGAQTRFATACAEASELLSGLSGRDKANVIWLKTEPQAVFPDELANNLGYLKDQLRRARVTAERGANEKAFALALDLLEGAEGKREICVISDFQKAGWEGFDPSVPDSIDVIHVKIGNRQAGNQAVIRLSSEPARPVVGEELEIYAEVANYSREDIETTAFSEVGESRRSQNLSLPAGETVTVVFRHTLTKAGPVAIKLSLAEDAFPEDDRRSLAIKVRPYLRVGVVAGDDSDTAKLWTRAAQSLRWAVPEWTSAAELGQGKAEEFDVLLLSGASLGEEQKIPLGTKVIALPAAGGGASREKSKGKPFLVSVAESEEPLFDLFRGGESGSVAGLAGDERIAWTPEEGEVLLAYEDGKPALVRLSPNRYRWLVPLSERPGSFAGRVEYVPFFAELLLADRKTGAAPGGGIDFEPGETVFWQPAETLSSDALELWDAGGEAREFLAGKEGRFSTNPVSAPGVLEWRAGGQTVGFSAINFPVSESNLATLTLEETQDSASVAVRGGGEVRHLRDGLKLWPWLFGAAIVFLLLESGVTLWSAKTP